VRRWCRTGRDEKREGEEADKDRKRTYHNQSTHDQNE
jgi:hypothetical protein